MEFKESELLRVFLSHWPESYHPADEKRFVTWAIKAHRHGVGFPRQEFEESGMTEEAVDYYQNAFRFVGYTLDALDE